MLTSSIIFVISVDCFMEFDVFISHSSKDKTMADAVCAKLEEAGIRCWIAPRDIKAGMTWSGEIKKAIDQCKVMVLVFSSNANESVQIIREVEAAVHCGKPILPLRIENILPSDSMAFFMNAVHWLDAISEPQERSLEKLVQAVSALLGVESVPKKDLKKEKQETAFNWKPMAYGAAAAGVLVVVAVLALFFLLRPKPDNSHSALVTDSGPVAPPTPSAPSVPAAVPTTILIPPPATTAPSVTAGSVDPEMTGTWHLNTHLFDYDCVATLTYDSSGTYKMETVVSDSGTFRSAGGEWTTTSNGSGTVRQGTYRYAGSHSMKVTGPLGVALYSPETPQEALDSTNPVMLGTWQSTVHPPNSPPWNMTLTNRTDGTYSFEIDIVDQGSFTSGGGRLTMRSHVLGTTVPGGYRALSQDSMDFTGTLGTATWSRN
jgi:hypothetical protein